jgi:Domain of unknown function (DUF4190)
VTSPDSGQLAPRPRPSRLALFALVCAIAGVLLLSVVGPFIAVIGLPAIMCGHSTRRKARETGQGGSRVALAALVIGYIGLALAPLYLAYVFFALSHMS